MSAKPKYAAALKNEVDVSEFIPYSSHVTQDIIKLESGDYLKIRASSGGAMAARPRPNLSQAQPERLPVCNPANRGPTASA